MTNYRRQALSPAYGSPVSGNVLPAATGHYSVPGGNTVAVTPTQSTEYAFPIMLSNVPGNAVRIGVNCTTLAAASVARLGIRLDAGLSYAYPGTLLLDAGTVATTGTGWKEITIDQTLYPGLILWLTCTSQGGAPSYTGINASVWPSIVNGSGNPAGTTHNAYTQTGQTGALDATFSTTIATAAIAPRVILRF